MKSYTGYTPNGVEVSCKIDPEKSEAIVEYEEYLRFFFNPDFPQDAKAFFEALRNVRGIVIDVGGNFTRSHALLRIPLQHKEPEKGHFIDRGQHLQLEPEHQACRKHSGLKERLTGCV